MDPSHPGARLTAFRKVRELSLREAADQLHTAHPVLGEWEKGTQVPAPAFREAIEVWTGGEIKVTDWPLSIREREITEKAALVVPAMPGRKARKAQARSDESGTDVTTDTSASGERHAVEVDRDGTGG